MLASAVSADFRAAVHRIHRRQQPTNERMLWHRADHCIVDQVGLVRPQRLEAEKAIATKQRGQPTKYLHIMVEIDAAMVVKRAQSRIVGYTIIASDGIGAPNEWAGKIDIAFVPFGDLKVRHDSPPLINALLRIFWQRVRSHPDIMDVPGDCHARVAFMSL